MECPLCKKSIQPTDETVTLAPDLGGYTVHKACWDALVPWIKKLLKEVDYDGRL